MDDSEEMNRGEARQCAVKEGESKVTRGAQAETRLSKDETDNPQCKRERQDEARLCKDKTNSLGWDKARLHEDNTDSPRWDKARQDEARLPEDKTDSPGCNKARLYEDKTDCLGWNKASQDEANMAKDVRQETEKKVDAELTLQGETKEPDEGRISETLLPGGTRLSKKRPNEKRLRQDEDGDCNVRKKRAIEYVANESEREVTKQKKPAEVCESMHGTAEKHESEQTEGKGFGTIQMEVEKAKTRCGEGGPSNVKDDVAKCETKIGNQQEDETKQNEVQKDEVTRGEKDKCNKRPAKPRPGKIKLRKARHKQKQIPVEVKQYAIRKSRVLESKGLHKAHLYEAITGANGAKLIQGETSQMKGSGSNEGKSKTKLKKTRSESKQEDARKNEGQSKAKLKKIVRNKDKQIQKIQFHTDKREAGKSNEQGNGKLKKAGERAVPLLTNHYLLTYQSPPLPPLVSYSLEVREHLVPVTLTIDDIRKVLTVMKETLPEVFAGITLVSAPSPGRVYSVGRIPFPQHSPLQFELNINGGDKVLQVTLREQEQVRVEEEAWPVIRANIYRRPAHQRKVTITQLVEWVMSQSLSSRYDVREPVVYPSTLSPSAYILPVSASKECHQGFTTAITPAGNYNAPDFHLTIDVTRRVVTRGVPLLQYLRTDLEIREGDLNTPLSLDSKIHVAHYLSNLMVVATYSGRMYKIIDVSQAGANTITFQLHNQLTNTSSPCTVAQYLAKCRGVQLIYPNFNCLQMAPADRDIFLPMEVCCVVGGQDVGWRVLWREMDAMKESTQMKEDDRQRYISSVLRWTPIIQDIAAAPLGITLNPQGVCVTGRVLARPPLLCGAGGQLYRPVKLLRWSVLHYDMEGIRGMKPNIYIKPFFKRLRRAAQRLGMQVAKPIIHIIRKTPNSIDSDFFDVTRLYPERQIVVVVLTPGCKYLYEICKCQSIHGRRLMTQCIRPETYRKRRKDETVLNSIMTQINSKCGGKALGINWRDMFPVSKVMMDGTVLMGAALVHPDHDTPNTGSMGAMVGVLDPEGDLRATNVYPQHRTQHLVHIKQLIINQICEYHQYKCQWPQRLLLYRAMVPVWAMDQVAKQELRDIQRAWPVLARRGMARTPDIIYMFCTTDHNTRVFVEGGVGGSETPPEGTIIDHTITNPAYMEFYITSVGRHFRISSMGDSQITVLRQHDGGNNGTRATLYRVMMEETGVPLPHLEAVTNALCYLHGYGTHHHPLPAPALHAIQAAKCSRAMAGYVEHIVMKKARDECHNPIFNVGNVATIDSENPLYKTLYFL